MRKQDERIHNQMVTILIKPTCMLQEEKLILNTEFTSLNEHEM